MQTIRVASRRSRLAMTQTQWVIEKLQAAVPEVEFEIVPVVTEGDRVLDVSLSKIGGKGLFVSEIERKILAGEADLAVHSLKDVPAELAPGLVLAAMPKREDPRDALIARPGITLQDLPSGAIVGTSSLRRAAQIKALRPDLRIEPLRGNIDTRLGRLEAGDFDAIILAAAGLVRMGWADRIHQVLPPEQVVPAIGQGILAIECRSDDTELRQLLQRIGDPETESEAAAERSLLARLGGSCQVPVGGLATPLPDGRLRLLGVVAGPDGHPLLRAEAVDTDPARLGQEVADRLFEQGAGPLLEATVAAHE
jgi:hydroxymethylbilane synthase